MEALLIVDMQNECFTVPRQNKDAVVKNINRVSDLFRKTGRPVIFIQHNGIKDNYLHPGTYGYKIIPDLTVCDQDIFIEKKVNSAFYETNLSETLRLRDIDTIYITGLATEFCVNATVMAALSCDFSVTVIADAHLTADRDILKAHDITRFYNWLWENLIPTAGVIRVISTDNVLVQI